MCLSSNSCTPSDDVLILPQVLKGDVKSAIETHEMLYQVMQRHNFLPEAFTTDFQVRGWPVLYSTVCEGRDS